MAGVLVAVSEISSRVGPVSLWIASIVAATVIGAAWAMHELRTASPLVDLRQLRLPMVLIADASVFLAGIGLYLMMTLASRYVQTPTSARYGVHGGVITAGLVLIPFSIFSYMASRIHPRLVRHVAPVVLVPVACMIVLAASVMFAVMRNDIWSVLAVMGVVGLGVGTLFATVPALITSSVEPAETSSAIGFNQVARTIGVTIGSALCGVVLAAATPVRAAVPSDRGYTVAALIGAGVLLVTAIAGVLAPPRPQKEKKHPVIHSYHQDRVSEP